MANEVVTVDNLVKRYGDKLAVEHFSLHIREGEILGLLGPNGSGKTTTINCILSLLKYDRGEIKIFGEKMTASNYALKRRIGVVMQNVAVVESLNVYENIDFFCGLYVKDRAKRRELVEEAIATTELSDYRKYLPKKLSGGLLRRLNIACGIAHKPELIIFDEPTVAVDPQSRNAILDGIRKLNKNGATIIYTSHYMEEVEDLCSRIVVIDKGKNLVDGTVAQLKGKLRNSETLTVETNSVTDEHINGLLKINHIYDVTKSGEKLIIKCDGGSHNLINVMNYLMENHVEFGRVNAEAPTLNDVFLEITGKELRD